MDSPAPARPPAPRLPFRLSLVALILLAAGYAWFLREHISPYAGDSDSSGYLNSAALLRAGRLSIPMAALPGHTSADFGYIAHLPLGFTNRLAADLMAPSYPPGLPLHLLAFSFLVGLDWAAIPLNIGAALAGGALLYLFARRLGLPRPLALAGVAVLLLCPLYLFSALQPMSDLLALVWTLTALFAALRARESAGWAVGCGVAVAVAVLVRPTNLLVIVPVALALGTAWRRYLWVGLGGLPGALLLGWYNRSAYGTPVTTGYGDVSAAFAGAFLPHNLWHFARWIPALLSPLVIAALAAPFTPAARRREFAVLASWAVLLICFYAFYYHSGETWWYLRFILPAFPVLILAALVAWHAFTAKAGRPALVGAVLLAAGLTWEIRLFRRLDVLGIKSGEATYPDTAAWARAQLPADAAIFCMQVSGAFHYYTDFLLVRWDMVRPEDMTRLMQTLHAQHRPAYAVLFDFEEQRARQSIGGRWTRLDRVRQATIWRIDPIFASP